MNEQELEDAVVDLKIRWLDAHKGHSMRAVLTSFCDVLEGYAVGEREEVAQYDPQEKVQ